MAYDINREDLAWAAGFLSGEGWFGASKGSRTNCKVLHVCASQVDPEPLHRLVKIFRFGAVHGPYIKRTRYRNTKPIYQFSIHNFEHAQAAIAMLWPWLSAFKKVQAKQALVDIHEARKMSKYRVRRRLNENEKLKIIEDYKITNNFKQTALKFNVSCQSVSRVVKGLNE